MEWILIVVLAIAAAWGWVTVLGVNHYRKEGAVFAQVTAEELERALSDADRLGD